MIDRPTGPRSSLARLFRAAAAGPPEQGRWASGRHDGAGPQGAEALPGATIMDRDRIGTPFAESSARSPRAFAIGGSTPARLHGPWIGAAALSRRAGPLYRSEPVRRGVLQGVDVMAEHHDLLVRKLASIADLTIAERQALTMVPMVLRDVPARQDIVQMGNRPSHCCLVLAGFAFRYKLLGDGRRQILNFHVPGDIPDLQSLHLPALDHTLASLTALTAGFIAHDAVHDLVARLPRLGGALWRNTLVDAALLRERIVCIGQRDGLSRTAHFLCEMFVRLEAVGLTDGATMVLPITQVEIADALGMSFVHINRMLKELRERKLVTIQGQTVALVDWDTLVALGDFDPAYLHLDSGDRPSRP